MLEFVAYDIAVVPVIIALIELVKRAGVPKRVLPVLSVALGIVAGFVYIAPGQADEAVLVGVVMGLSAVGLYSGAKNSGSHSGEGDKGDKD